MELSLSQQDIFFDQLLHPEEPIYNIGAKILIEGTLNYEAIQLAYVELINQHDAFRCIFVHDARGVSQHILKQHASSLNFKDFSSSPNALEKADDFMRKEFKTPFDVTSGELLHSFTLIKVAESLHYLFSFYHHIITDGWGTSLMFQRLVRNYNEILNFGKVQGLYPYDYKAFIEDDMCYADSRDFVADAGYWASRFRELPDSLLEPTTNSSLRRVSGHHKFVVPRKFYDQLTHFSVVHRCSTFHVILGAVFAYFARRSGNADFSIGIPVLNRSNAVFRSTVGMFMGVSPLRIQTNFENTFVEHVSAIRKQLRLDYRHQRYPLGRLIGDLGLIQDRKKLFNITLSYEKQNYSDHFSGTRTTVVPLSHHAERGALAIYVREFDDTEDVQMDFDFNFDYFDEATAKRISEHFEITLKDLVAHPHRKIRELQYLSMDESLFLGAQSGVRELREPRDVTFLSHFFEQVKAAGDKVAVYDGTTTYTYRELNRLSQGVATYIDSVCGPGEKSPVSVLMERSSALIPVLLGIMMSGRPYIPLDPGFPTERLNFILNESRSTFLIQDQEYYLDKSDDVAVFLLDTLMREASAQDSESCKARASAEDTAYIIYTSGSTGNPKGVEIGHRSLMNLLASIGLRPGITSEDVLFSVTTYSFDISILEFFAPLTLGATLYVAKREMLSDPLSIVDHLDKIAPTMIQATPSFFQMLFDVNWSGSKGLKVLCGGDLLSQSLAEKLIRTCAEVWNMYGPTETTIWSSCKKVEAPEESSNIGTPLLRTRFYVLDDFFYFKPIGVPGEIYIGGVGLAKGYYGNEQLTASRFLSDPYHEGTKIYKTGDIGRWNDNGEIEFLGRNDDQVKIRGYRIELGEIESRLNRIPGIHASVLVTKRNSAGEGQLVAYVICDDAQFDLDETYRTLRNALPFYMIPSWIIQVENFPKTPNQKIDRKLIGSWDIQQATDTIVAHPVTKMEGAISEYIAEVLDSKLPIGRDQNFFELGGHSLGAVKLIGMIAGNLNQHISLREVFEHPTVSKLSAYLEGLRPEYHPAIDWALEEREEYFRVTNSQYLIWLASQRSSVSKAYNMSAVYEIKGTVSLDSLKTAVGQLIARHEALRTNFLQIGDGVFQKVSPPAETDIATFKVRESDLHMQIDQLLDVEFNLESDLLLRVSVVESDSGSKMIVFLVHHIIMDGLSLEVFVREFAESYNMSLRGTTLPDSSARRLQFADYSELQKKVSKTRAADDLQYWEEYLKGYQNRALVLGRGNGGRDQKNARMQFQIDVNTRLRIRQLVQNEGTTNFVFFASAFSIFCSKQFGFNDLCIGYISSCRISAEFDRVIGMFAKTLILRSSFTNEKKSFSEELARVRHDFLTAQAYQDAPLDIFSKIKLEALLVYQNPDWSFDCMDEFQDFQLVNYAVVPKYSRMPIVFNFVESKETISVLIDYAADLFTENAIHVIAARFNTLLDEIVATPGVPLSALSFEKAGLKNEFELEFDF